MVANTDYVFITVLLIAVIGILGPPVMLIVESKRHK